MLFNSFAFLLVFLPCTFLLTEATSRFLSARFAMATLTVASWVFYAFSGIRFLGLLLALTIVNYLIGRFIAGSSDPFKRAFLAIGCALNLSVLGYFKYRGFAIDTIDSAFGLHFPIPQLILPLGISFFIFQKIAFLADSYAGRIKKFDFLEYCLFVAFFPQLIAGPIVHYTEMQPQFDRTPWAALRSTDFVRGFALISIGLFKKVVLADSLSPNADWLFNTGGQLHLSWIDAVVGMLSFGFQIYFDFSGYSDIAIGLAALFGLQLPLNFSSPYKSLSIIEFWRTWHMTLSRFLRDYLYIPLGGNRHGVLRRYANLIVTMVLGGLWHGPAWTFAVWGLLHGAYLCVNHLWRYLCERSHACARVDDLPGISFLYWCLTFVAVMLAWCLFRAPSFATGIDVITALADPDWAAETHFGIQDITLTVVAWAWVVLLPNSQEVVSRIETSRPRWQPWYGAAIGFAFTCSLYFINIGQHENFIYFRF
ncbi:MAG TPA: MBOAT family O-acyltransferase [Rhizomicrobium sp.]|jgi:D-alanyl-lipoteichoic acid acyltransferase DltB (MBOAT superfamily)|nr:MBOAT family O-acyltransferase [Rhizomicrobium sp.]